MLEDCGRFGVCRPVAVLVGSVGLSVLLLAAGLGTATWTDYVETVAKAERTTRDVARLLEEHVTGTVALADLILRRMADLIDARGMAFTGTRQGWETVRAMAEDLPQLGSAWVLDDAGDTVLATHQFPPPAVNSADRPYFRAHQAGEESYVGELIVGRATGKTFFTVSRRLGKERFGGIVLAAVQADYFSDLWREMELGDDSVLAIYRQDGGIVVRHPAAPAAGAAGGARALVEAAKISDDGTIAGESAIDGIRRITSYRRLGELPLFVVAAVSRKAVLADFRHRLARNLGLLLLGAAGLGALAWLGVAALRREREALAAERAANGRLERIADRLRGEERQVGLALSLSPLTLFGLDRNLRFTWLRNPPLGLSEEQVVGRTAAELMPPHQAAAVETMMRRALEVGGRVRGEVPITLKGSREVHFFDFVVEPALADGGEAAGLTGAALDISERKRMVADLERARADAEQANLAKSRFLAAASHDLRQPYQAMALFHSFLSGQLTDPGQRRALDALGSAMKAGEELLSALLDLSVLDSGSQTPRPEPIVVADLLDGVAREFQATATAQGLSLRYVPCTAVVATDPRMFGRMVRNLVSNAIKYTPSGKVLLGCRRVGGEVRVEVWDTGPGIPADKRDAIFDEFIRLDSPDRERVRGLGLGLAIVARTGRLLGHAVAVRSWPGRGSVFSIRMPAARPAPAVLDGAAA